LDIFIAQIFKSKNIKTIYGINNQLLNFLYAVKRTPLVTRMINLKALLIRKNVKMKKY